MTDYPGLGVLLNMLRGNEDTLTALRSVLGKSIVSMKLEDDELRMRFADGSGVKIWDDGQSCCEDRYMQTDDDLASFKDADFLDLEIRDASEIPNDYDTHEVQFLEIKTSKGVATFASHNVHNGYYGGFSIQARAIR